jgi:asparagine synthetase B (glutamine-hydrolysing)
MFDNINKLLPGHTLVCENGMVKIKKFWDIDQIQNREDRERNLY